MPWISIKLYKIGDSVFQKLLYKIMTTRTCQFQWTVQSMFGKWLQIGTSHFFPNKSYGVNISSHLKLNICNHRYLGQVIYKIEWSVLISQKHLTTINNCNRSSRNPWKLCFRHVLFHEKTDFLVLAGSAFYQIWVFHEMKCDGIRGVFIQFIYMYIKFVS